MSRSPVVVFGTNYIMQLDDKPGVLFWTCPLAVDGDGHPMCYHPSGSPPGLDYLANAGSPGNWWGIATDSRGVPYTQGPGDEAPGFYISTTALIDSGQSIQDPIRYVHSGKIPYVVLPNNPKFDPKQTLGDLLMCFNNKTGLQTWAVYADIGPSNQIGEGSMRLCELLGINPDPKRGGTSEEVIAMIYFPGSSLGWPQPEDDLAAEAYRLFDQWGGYDSAQAGLPQFDWSQFAPTPAPSSDEFVVTITIDAPPGVTVNVIKA